jgi:hypothetical protein
MGHEPNNLGEAKRITTFLASKLKRCTHKNMVEKDPNGKLQRLPKLKPKFKLKAKETGLEDSLKTLLTNKEIA